MESLNAVLSLNPSLLTPTERDLEFYQDQSLSNQDIKGRNLGQFLTGDINLGFSRNLPAPVYHLIDNHFRHLRHRTIVGLIPHHGARSYWTSRIFETQFTPEYWVACALFPRNQYNHPNLNVINDILQRNQFSYWCHQNRAVCIEANIRFQDISIVN